MLRTGFSGSIHCLGRSADSGERSVQFTQWVRKVLQFIGAKFFYNLDKKALAKMETELKEKRG